MKDYAEFALKYLQKLGVDYAEVRLEETNSESFVLKNGVPEVSGFEEIKGIGARFLIKNGLGFFSTNDFSKEKIKGLIQDAIKKVQKASKIKESVNLSEEPIHKKTYDVKQKIKIEDMGPDEKLKLLTDSDKAMVKSGVKVPSRYLSYSDMTTTEYFLTSEGSKILATVPRENYFFFVTVQENGKLSQRYSSFGATGGYEQVKIWNVSGMMVEEVKGLQKNLRNGIKVKGKYDLICGPEVVGIMVHESVGHPYEADRIFGREAAQAGESFVTKEMVGQQIGSEIVNVVDDPTLPKSYGFYLFDNEGVKARRKFLMKNGKINEFLHNRETATHMGIRSNGSSRATDYDKESIVRMSNTILLPGEFNEEELLDVKKGIYMKNFMEWNIDDKRFTQKYTGSEAYLVEKGEITKPVSNPVIEITTPNLWKAVDAIAKKPRYFAGNCGKGEPMQPIPVWFGGPAMRLKNIWVYS
ncbi:TldD/PmbA family protein [Candidatus Woesearchaeota archaeon]|nr:TldD/PmbA family protein [Candidatus Woesearchaeota archaeon]